MEQKGGDSHLSTKLRSALVRFVKLKDGDQEIQREISKANFYTNSWSPAPICFFSSPSLFDFFFLKSWLSSSLLLLLLWWWGVEYRIRFIDWDLKEIVNCGLLMLRMPYISKVLGWRLMLNWFKALLEGLINDGLMSYRVKVSWGMNSTEVC